MDTRLDPEAWRLRFPALRRQLGGQPVVYADGPGGTQVPRSVIEAMSAFLSTGGANLGGKFPSSSETEAVVGEARMAMADLFGAADPDSIVFGQNMTSLTFAVSRAIGRSWKAGDRIAVTNLDHDANITPWVVAAAERGVEVDRVDFHPEDGSLDRAAMEDALERRPRLVAVTHASNALGTVVDVGWVAERAHRVGALVWVDAVHLAPHRSIDVTATDCDFLVASAYKFFGPHTGIMYGKRELLESLTPDKVRPAPDRGAGKWETGTQSFESLAGVTAAVDYLAEIGHSVAGEGGRRRRLQAGMGAIAAHEAALSARFLAGVAARPQLRVFGITDPAGDRTPTFALAVGDRPAEQVAAELGRRGIFVWSGHYYAVAVMERLGRLESGGLVRIGFVHTTTPAEVDRVLAELGRLV